MMHSTLGGLYRVFFRFPLILMAQSMGFSSSGRVGKHQPDFHKELLLFSLLLQFQRLRELDLKLEELAF